MSGQARDGVAWLDRALALPGLVGCDARTPALTWHAWLAGVAGFEVDYAARAEQMVDLLRQGDDRDLHTFGLFAHRGTAPRLGRDRALATPVRGSVGRREPRTTDSRGT